MGLFFQSTGEHFRHGAFLQVQVVEHDFELCAILRHIVGFTAKKGVFTFTDVVDFFCQNQPYIEELENITPIIKNLRTDADKMYAFFIDNDKEKQNI